jgi:hypothetical protein
MNHKAERTMKNDMANGRSRSAWNRRLAIVVLAAEFPETAW